MVSSFLPSSSSIRKKSKKTRIYLDSLPEDLLVEISSCTGASSLSAVRNLRIVSKSFRRICDERYVFYRLSLKEIDYPPWHQNSEIFFERCRKSGNPEALYQKGFINYFRDDLKHEGLEYLAEAAEKGNREAKYVYGLILICLGDKTKQKGFKILSSVIKPLMSTTMEEMVELRYKIKKIRDSVLWPDNPVMERLKTVYVREKCKCDCKTRMLLVRNHGWYRHGDDTDMNISSACEFCLLHHEVELFLR
ncbi:F-box domain [Arabidopsis suecica]|uniref:F-box domain n=1 Tax=Arabidopsis suecica TaxID=45249 RepID=A0A8T2BSH4_ARASU|nr:F-box domain [Arabidopsis suecica]